MFNRIALLELEHDKTTKRTFITKQKAADILQAKVMNEERQKELMRVAKERADEEERQRLTNVQMKMASRREAFIRKQILEQRVQTSAERRKMQRVENEEMRKSNNEAAQEEARIKRMLVQREEDRIRNKIQRYKDNRVYEGKPMRDARLMSEAERIEQADAIMRELEQKEQEVL